MHSNQDILNVISDAIQDKKGSGITVVDLEAIESVSDIEICNLSGKKHFAGFCNCGLRTRGNPKSIGSKPYNYDGYRNSQWIVIDYGNVMVHVFCRSIANSIILRNYGVTRV